MRVFRTFTTILSILFGFQALAQNYTYIGSYDNQGVPESMATPDVLDDGFLSRVSASLPESYPVPYYNPDYITTGTETNIVLQDSANVWITFVAEGAGYRNSLGYYLFDANNPPSSRPTEAEINIVFPNVSRLYSGGGLLPGDKVHIGTFPPGTGIGWVLIANGWNGRNVGYGNWTLFSTPSFNPETNPNLKYHNVQLIDTETERIVLGFEDIRRDYSSCDQDFNDAIFYVSADPIEAIVLNNINYTTPVEGSISSGNQGGLESDGSLAEKIAKRNVQRELIAKDPERYYSTSMETHSQVKGIFSIASETPLSALVPDLGPDSTEAYQSTPTDLLELTNAIEVLSVDYFDGEEREAVCLVTKTQNEVYSHTKSICDRVGGAELISTNTILVGGVYPGTLISLRREDGGIEYAMSFSLKEKTDTEYEYNSHWNIGDYPAGGTYLNFQLWGRKPIDVFYLSEKILEIFDNSFDISKDPVFSASPDLVMRYGEYVQGKFRATLINKKRKTGNVKFEGTLRNSEQTTSVAFADSVALTGDYPQIVEFSTPGVFDAGLNIYLESPSDEDAIYLADGAWIANYEEANVANTSLTIHPLDKIVPGDNHYWIERSFVASGEVKNYYSVHRPLRLGLRKVDLTDYGYLSFVAKGNTPVEIVVSHEGITAWESQPRKVLALTGTAKRYYLPLSDFLDNLGNSAINNDITALTFSVIGDNSEFESFDFEFNNISFSKVNGCENNTAVMATAYANEVHSSTGNMVATNKSEVGAKVIYTSENSIEFKPGFVAEAGSVISAQIEGCSN